MEISPTPQILMQNLLDGTKLILIGLLNSEISNLTPVEQHRLTDALTLSEHYSIEGGIHQDDCELLKVLRYLWKDWDLLKDKIFLSNEENGFGKTTRSYISILMQARNDWAHDTLTYEDVIHYGFVVQRLKKSIQINVDDSFADQIIDFCIEKINVKQVKNIEEITVEADYIENGSIKTKENDVNLGDKKLEETEEIVVKEKSSAGKIIYFAEESEEDKEVSIEEENDDGDESIIQEDAEERDEIHFNFEIEELNQYSEEELNDLFKLCHIIEKNEYDSLSIWVAYPKIITVQPGKFPDTLYFSDGFISFAFGLRKIQLIREYFREISSFALFGKIKSSMQGSYQDYPVICIPSKEDTIMMFGKTKAQIISASWQNIMDWKQDYQ